MTRKQSTYAIVQGAPGAQGSQGQVGPITIPSDLTVASMTVSGATTLGSSNANTVNVSGASILSGLLSVAGNLSFTGSSPTITGNPTSPVVTGLLSANQNVASTASGYFTIPLSPTPIIVNYGTDTSPTVNSAGTGGNNVATNAIPFFQTFPNACLAVWVNFSSAMAANVQLGINRYTATNSGVTFHLFNGGSAAGSAQLSFVAIGY